MIPIGTQAFKARVVSVYRDGPHGPYAVAYPDTSGREEESYTFSLDSPVWEEKDLPESGQIVILEDIRRKKAGWRAYKARFFRREDETK